MVVEKARTTFRRGLLLSTAGSAVSLILLFLELVIIARFLPTATYGRYVLLVAAANFAVMLIDCGCKLAVTQAISIGDELRQEAVVCTALVFRIVTLLLTSMAFLLGCRLLALWRPGWDIQWLAVALPAMVASASLDELLFAMLQGFHAYREMALVQTARGLLRVGCAVLFLIVFHGGLTVLVCSWSATFGLAVLYEFWALPAQKRWRLSRESLVWLLRFGRPLQVMRFLGFVSDRLHVTVLGALAGVDSVAYFAIANRIPDALQTLSDSYFRVYFPTVSTLLASGRSAAAELVFHRSLRLVSFSAGLAAVVAVVFRHEIITVLFSARYARSAPAFALLMIALHVTVVVNVLGYTLTATGRPGRALWLDVGQAGALALGDVVFIPVLGTLGAACAALFGSYASGPLGLWLLRRGELATEVVPHVRQALIVLVCAGVSWVVQPDALLPSLAAKLCVLVLFLVLSLRLATIRPDDVALVLPRDLWGRGRWGMRLLGLRSAPVE